MKRLIAAGVLMLLVLAACGGGQSTTFEKGDIVVEDPWARSAILEGGNGAAYMVIRNTGSEDDVLLEAYTSAANMTEVHEVVAVTADDMEGMSDEGDMGDMEGDMSGEMMQMRPAGPLTIPAGGSVALEVGGYHVMMMGMSQQFEPGEMLTLTLVFEKAGELTIEAEVRAE